MRRLETLRELNFGRCIAGYSDVLPENIVLSESFTRFDLLALLANHIVSDHMKVALSGVQSSMYLVVAPRELLTVTTRYAASMVFLYGWLLDVWMRRVCISSDWGGWSWLLDIESGWYFYCGAPALFMTLRHIGEAIQSPERCLV
jgi:hypothetical protein